MVGIYKITNNINGKIYMGQSVNINKRFMQHCNNAAYKYTDKYNHPLYNEIRLYGVDNFTFEIIEECSSDELNDKERQWIIYCNAVNEGYNILYSGDSNGKFSDNDIKEVIELLYNYNYTMEDIADKFHTTSRTIRDINTGRTYYDSAIEYPIRDKSTNFKIYSVKQNNESDDDINQQVADYTLIKDRYSNCIRCGNKIPFRHKYCNNCLHIAQHEQAVVGAERDIVKDCEDGTLLQFILEGKDFIYLGALYNLTDNCVRKWCKKYNIPFIKRDIRDYKFKHDMEFRDKYTFVKPRIYYIIDGMKKTATAWRKYLSISNGTFCRMIDGMSVDDIFRLLIEKYKQFKQYN